MLIDWIITSCRGTMQLTAMALVYITLTLATSIEALGLITVC